MALGGNTTMTSSGAGIAFEGPVNRLGGGLVTHSNGNPQQSCSYSRATPSAVFVVALYSMQTFCLAAEAENIVFSGAACFLARRKGLLESSPSRDLDWRRHADQYSREIP